MTDKTGGAAFPAPDFIVPESLKAEHIHRLGTTQGMTLRDYFAAKAMGRMDSLTWSGSRFHQKVYDNVAAHAYRFADAMLRAREAQ